MLLDRIDKKICYYFAKNARVSLTSLSENIGLSREAINARIKKLQKERVILSLTTIYNHPYFGLNFYDFYINFIRLDAKKHEIFEKYIKSHPSVLWSNKCLGKWDYAMFLIITGPLDLDKVLSDFKEKFRGFIKDFEFDQILYEYNFSVIVQEFFEDVEKKDFIVRKDDSSFFKLLNTGSAGVEKSWQKVEIDKIDVQIMELLSKNCRRPIQDISAKIGVPAENVRYRMKKLVEKKVLAGFWASINYDLFGLHWYRIRLRTNRISDQEEKALRQHFLNHPNIFWARRSVGKTDVQIDLRIKGNNELNGFLAELNTKFEGLIIDYEVIIMTQEQDYNNFSKKFYEIAKE